jgi:GPH family glycoside/pentoside/hexuronide:cation symporter
MVAGMIIFPTGFVAIFSCPFTGAAAAWWVAVVIALTGAGFSAFVVPFGVLPAELGASSEERRSMTAWRMAFLGVAILAAGALAPLMVSAGGGGPQGYRLMAVAMGGVVLLGTCAAVYSARRSARTTVSAPSQSTGSLRDALTAARHNRSFSSIFIVFMLIEVVISVALAGLPYIAEQHLGSQDVVAPLFVCVLGPLLLTMPIWTRSARRFGDKRCLQVALALLGLGASMSTALLWAHESDRFPIACAAFLVAGVGFAGAQLLPNTMLANTLADAGDAGQRRAGNRLFDVAFRVSPTGDDKTIDEARRLLTAYLETYQPQPSKARRPK